EMTKPGTPKLLRSVQPGAGFVWANLDMAALKRQNSELSTAPAPFQGVIDSMTGEMIVAGSAEPAGVQIQLGVSNVAPFTSVLEFGSSFISKDQQPQELPDFPGSQFTVENKQVQAGINALHMA